MRATTFWLEISDIERIIILFRAVVSVAALFLYAKTARGITDRIKKSVVGIKNKIELYTIVREKKRGKIGELSTI